MDILFAGNTAAVSEGFYNAIEKEYRCIVLNESCTKDKLKKKNILFFKSENDEDTEHIFRSFNFETVVFFSRVLDGEKKIFDELEKLEYILYLCRKRNISSFIYITGTRPQEDRKKGEMSREVLLAACEQLCRKAAQVQGLRVQLLRVPYLYHTVIKTSHAGRWLDTVLSGKQLVLPGYESTQTDFLREDDLALLLCRMFDDPWEEPYLDSNVSGRNKISFEELAKLYTELGREHGVQVEVKYSGKDECTPLYQTDEWARREYGWAPMADIRRDLEEASHSQLERNNKNKNRRAHSILSRRIFRIVVEQIVLFAVAEALNYLTRDNGMFNFIDFRFVYITIIACINGLGAGAVSALMAGVGYIFSNAAQMSWQVLFFNVQNWLPFACYLLIGCVLGYNRDKARDDIKSKADELRLLEEKYDFLQGLYT